MTLGKSINPRESPIELYIGRWVNIDFNNNRYAGILAQIGKHDGSLILQPCLKVMHISHSLPAMYIFTSEPTMLIPVQMPFAVTPTSEEELAYFG